MNGTTAGIASGRAPAAAPASALERVHLRSLATARGLDAVAILGLMVLSGVLASLTWGTWGDLAADTGYDLVAGARVAGGDIPYVDFDYHYGPLAPALLGLAAWVGGNGLLPAILLGVGVSCAIVAGVFALARMVVAPLGAFLAAAATAAVAFSPTNLSFVLPHAESAPLAILFSLAFLVALGRYIGGGGTRWLVASGVCAGLVGLTRPEFAAAVLFAAVVWSLLRIRARLSTRREILAFLACAVAIPAATYGAFLTAISPQTLLFENLVPLDVLSGGANEILRLHAPLTPSSILEVAGYLALYVAGVAVLLLLARLLARSTRAPRLTLLVCAVLATAFVAMLALRPETVRYGLKFAYGWIPAGVAVALAVALWYARRRGARWEPKEQIELVTAALLAVLAAKTYAVFFIHSSEPQYAVYALPFAAVLLARLHLGRLGRRRPAYWLGALWMVALVTSGVALTIRDARVESAEVRGPGGVVRDRPAEAQAYQDALAWIAKETRPGEPILLAPQLTTLYTLSERESPLPELALQPGALPTVEDERAAITRLEEAGVRLVVVDRRSFQEFGHTTFGDSFDRVLAGWIRSRFAVAATVGTNLPAARALEIWTRRHS